MMKFENCRYWVINWYTGECFISDCLQRCVKRVSSMLRENAQEKRYTYGVIDDKKTGIRYVTNDGKNWIIQENEVNVNEF